MHKILSCNCKKKHVQRYIKINNDDKILPVLSLKKIYNLQNRSIFVYRNFKSLIIHSVFRIVKKINNSDKFVDAVNEYSMIEIFLFIFPEFRKY